MILKKYPNTKETAQIGLDMLYQAEITNYINIRIEFKENLRRWYILVWMFCNKEPKK